jgi:hypothetical protein
VRHRSRTCCRSSLHLHKSQVEHGWVPRRILYLELRSQAAGSAIRVCTPASMKCLLRRCVLRLAGSDIIETNNPAFGQALVPCSATSKECEPHLFSRIYLVTRLKLKSQQKRCSQSEQLFGPLFWRAYLQDSEGPPWSRRHSELLMRRERLCSLVGFTHMEARGASGLRWGY